MEVQETNVWLELLDCERESLLLQFFSGVLMSGRHREGMGVGVGVGVDEDGGEGEGTLEVGEMGTCRDSQEEVVGSGCFLVVGLSTVYTHPQNDQ